MRVGVLALQGDFREHAALLDGMGHEPVLIRKAEQLPGSEALIVPGGESTTIGKLAERYGLLEPLRQKIAGGLPTLGTCAGLYVLNFLRLRDLPVDDARLTVRTVKDPDGKRLSSITIRVDMPETFPEKYRKAILNAVNLCNVKRLLTDPPRIETIVEIGGQVVAADHTA